LYDGIADLQKCYLRAKSIDHDEDDITKKRFKTRMPIAKTALNIYENPVSPR
jgi:hypothetical protein